VLFNPKNMILQSPDATGNTGGTSATGDQNQTPLVSMSQAQLDALFAERAKRGGEAAVNELVTALGFKTVDELKASFAAAKKAADEKLSDEEKKAKALKDAEDRATKAEQDRDAALKQASERLLKAEIIAEAARQGFLPEAVADVFLVIDRTKISEKDGAFTGVKEAVEGVAKSKPFWLGTQQPEKKPAVGTPKPPQRKDATEEKPHKAASLTL